MTTFRDPVRRAGALLLAASLALLIVPAVALGHAELETATPADGSTVTEPVAEVSGTYSEAMAPDESSLTVRDANGDVVAKGGVDPEDDTRMVAIPDVPLRDGDYEVRSVATATDGHLERVRWFFSVAISASPSPTTSPPPTATPTASETAGATPTATAEASATASVTPVPATASPSLGPTPEPTPSTDTTAGGGGDVLLPIAIALIILGVGAAFLLSRRNRPSDPA